MDVISKTHQKMLAAPLRSHVKSMAKESNAEMQAWLAEEFPDEANKPSMKSGYDLVSDYYWDILPMTSENLGLGDDDAVDEDQFGDLDEKYAKFHDSAKKVTKLEGLVKNNYKLDISSRKYVIGVQEMQLQEGTKQGVMKELLQVCCHDTYN